MMDITVQQTEQQDPTLVDVCRHCLFQQPRPAEELDQAVLARNYTDDRVSYIHYVNDSIKHDPTLPRYDTIACANPSCTAQPPQVIAINYAPTELRYLYHCTHCSAFWKLGEKPIAATRDPEATTSVKLPSA